MGIEKRRSRRTDIDVTISLRQLDDKYVTGYSGDTVTVNVINISKDGIAFKSDYEFRLNTYYDTDIRLSNGESFEAVIEVIRMENLGEIETTYGCAAAFVQVRKVRASQGRMPDNIRWRRLQGQCNRNIPPWRKLW